MLPSVPGITGVTGGATVLKEADFYIHQLYPINFFGSTVYITTTHIYHRHGSTHDIHSCRKALLYEGGARAQDDYIFNSYRDRR